MQHFHITWKFFIWKLYYPLKYYIIFPKCNIFSFAEAKRCSATSLDAIKFKGKYLSCLCLVPPISSLVDAFEILVLLPLLRSCTALVVFLLVCFIRLKYVDTWRKAPFLASLLTCWGKALSYQEDFVRVKLLGNIHCLYARYSYRHAQE